MHVTVDRAGCAHPVRLGSARACTPSSSPRPRDPVAPGPSECRDHPPAGAWRTNASAHPHTAHESSPAIIHYRHHPFHGEHVTIVRRLRRYTTDCVVIQLADDVQVAVPTWMLDPLVCQQLSDDAHPRISVAALCDLRTLLDSQAVAVPTTAINSEGSPQAGGDDARPDRASTETTDADLRPTRPVANTPGAGSPAVPRSPGTTTERGAARRGTHKERG